MNNIYDLAHQLKRAIMNSPEYKNYMEKKNVVYSNEKNKNMVEDFRKQALELQMKQISGQKVDEKEIEKLRNLENILRLNPTINEFLLAEYRFSQMVQDITKIIGEALDMYKDINI
ncbi:MAG TPA: YlbF family regulator [Tissierellia bacterium]|nr:YlbF family regulator [Tissierellia bacterium]